MNNGIKDYLPEALELASEYAGSEYAQIFRYEDQLQAYCFKWWNKHFRSFSRLYAIPNGGTRIFAEVQGMIAAGLVSGVFDLELKFSPGVSVPIEMKNAPVRHEKQTGTYLRPDQMVFAAHLRKLGFNHYCAKTFFEFAVIVCHELKLNVRDYL